MQLTKHLSGKRGEREALIFFLQKNRSCCFIPKVQVKPTMEQYPELQYTQTSSL